jgi:acetyl-CoA carboxylase biotin carboxylase subunit
VPIRQEELVLRGHAIECRIVAEDPARNFVPCPGTIRGVRPAAGPGIRYDDGTYTGYEVPLHYDALLAKLIAWGRDRAEAARRMARALDELRIDGLPTSVSFHKKVMEHPAFLAGDLHTGFLGAHPELLQPASDPWLEDIAILAAAIHHFRKVEERSTRQTATRTGSAWKWQHRQGWR